MADLIKIELTNEDAQLFIEFQKRYNFVKLLSDLKVFDIRSGTLEVNFDNQGNIGSINIHKFIKL